MDFAEALAAKPPIQLPPSGAVDIKVECQLRVLATFTKTVILLGIFTDVGGC